MRPELRIISNASGISRHHFAPRSRERSEAIFIRESQRIPNQYERVVMHQGNFKYRSYKIIKETNAPLPPTNPAASAKRHPSPDRELLPALAQRLNERTVGTRRDRVSRICGGLVRDKLDLAWRWLRRFTNGTWYLGGHHIARANFGPALCEKRQKFYTGRLS